MPWSLGRSSGGFQIKVDFWVKFHRNLAGELPLLMNAVRLREAPEIYGATRVAPHFGSSAAPVLTVEGPLGRPLGAC